MPGLLARFRRHGGFGLVALVGVQSNQYPRALDIARPFREAGIPVAMGGFHVSGCLSMLDGRAVDLDACRELGIAAYLMKPIGQTELLEGLLAVLGTPAGGPQPLHVAGGRSLGENGRKLLSGELET